jgi:hypothetical protein
VESRGLYFTKTVDESLVVLVSVVAMVDLPMTVWTKRNHPPRMIRAYNRDFMHVVEFWG